MVGRVRAVDGEFMTLAVFGLGDQQAEGAEVIPGAGGARRYARIRLEALLAHWVPVHGGTAPRGEIRPRTAVEAEPA